MYSSNIPRRLLARSGSRGMTLVEILVVLAIIGLIVGGVAVVAGGAFTDAQGKTARNEVVQVEQAGEMYMVQKSGKCPKTMQDLKAGGVLKKVKKDPWGTEYQIKCPGEHGGIDVSSAGPDKEFGNADDVNSWDEDAAEAGEAKAED
jgi:general secretion pathway protein G